jgi:hypothetical protein
MALERSAGKHGRLNSVSVPNPSLFGEGFAAAPPQEIPSRLAQPKHKRSIAPSEA